MVAPRPKTASPVGPGVKPVTLPFFFFVQSIPFSLLLAEFATTSAMPPTEPVPNPCGK